MSQQDYDQDGQPFYEDDEDGYNYEDDPNVRPVNPQQGEPQPVEQPKRRETVIPIGEAVTPETLHGVVAFTRSLNLGSRDNNAHYRCEMPFVVQPGWAPDQCAAQAADAFYQCVAVVLQQAGLPFAVGDDGVLREVMKQFPGARQERTENRERTRPDPDEQLGDYGRRQPQGQRGGFPHPAEMDKPEHIRSDDWRDLCQNYEDWYDNREDKANGDGYGNGPDFKRKDDGKGLWLRPFRRDGERGGRGHARSGGGRGRNY